MLRQGFKFDQMTEGPLVRLQIQTALSSLIKGGLRIWSLSALLLLTSCTPFNDLIGKGGTSSSSPKVWIPWPDEDGVYRFQKVTVSTIKSWAPLQGSAAEIRGNASPTSDGRHLSSQQIHLEFNEDKDGAVIPMSRYSIEVAALYAHFERFQQNDRDLGLIGADVPRKVFVGYRAGLAPEEREEMALSGSSSSVINLFSHLNNAYYDTGTDAYYVLPYRMGGLPISVNGAVLAHEHFHSIFSRLLIQPIQAWAQREQGKRLFDLDHLTPHALETSSGGGRPMEGGLLAQGGGSESTPFGSLENKENIFINRVLFLGINEGLADVWGWFYGGNPCFMTTTYGHDLGGRRCLNSSQGIQRAIAINDIALQFQFRAGPPSDQAIDLGYEVGSDLAQMIYLRIKERNELKDRVRHLQWEKWITTVLPELVEPFKKSLLNGSSESVPLLPWNTMRDQILFGEGTPDVPNMRCHSWEQIFTGVLDEMPHLRRQCPAIKEKTSRLMDSTKSDRTRRSSSLQLDLEWRLWV